MTNAHNLDPNWWKTSLEGLGADAESIDRIDNAVRGHESNVDPDHRWLADRTHRATYALRSSGADARVIADLIEHPLWPSAVALLGDDAGVRIADVCNAFGAEPSALLADKRERKERDDWRRWCFEKEALLAYLIDKIGAPPLGPRTEPDGVTADDELMLTDAPPVEIAVELDAMGPVTASYHADSDYAAALAELDRRNSEEAGRG